MTDPGTGQAQHPKVALDLLLSADREPTNSIHPDLCTLHDATAFPEPRLPPDRSASSPFARMRAVNSHSSASSGMASESPRHSDRALEEIGSSRETTSWPSIGLILRVEAEILLSRGSSRHEARRPIPAFSGESGSLKGLTRLPLGQVAVEDGLHFMNDR
jgi:hypothetical protein